MIVLVYKGKGLQIIDYVDSAVMDDSFITLESEEYNVVSIPYDRVVIYTQSGVKLEDKCSPKLKGEKDGN